MPYVFVIIGQHCMRESTREHLYCACGSFCPRNSLCVNIGFKIKLPIKTPSILSNF